VRFIAKTCLLSDFREGATPFLKLLAGVRDTQIGNVISDGFTEVAAKAYGHGRPVNPRCRSDLRQSQLSRVFGSN
jgi:hypothetical protein